MGGSRRAFLVGLFGAGCGLAVGCANGGNFSLFGYTTAPPFDPDIRSVYVPTFKLMPVVGTPFRSTDVDLTQAVVQELTARKSPIKVVSDPARADTELIGTIVLLYKSVLTRTNQALPLESEVVIVTEIVWRDLKTGNILTNFKSPKRAGPEPLAFDPHLQPPAPKDPNEKPFDKPLPVRVTASGRMLTQNGESVSTALDMACQKAARFIVDKMEAPWDLK